MTKALDIFKVKNAADYTYSPSFTYPGKIGTEIFMKPSEATPALSSIFNVRQGIRTDEYLVLATEMGRVVTANPGCTPTYTASNTLSDRKITVKKLGVYGEWCKDDWTAVANQLAEDPSWVADGNSGYELTAKLQRFLIEARLDAVRRDLFSLAFFANDTVATSNFYYGNGMEGLFVKLYDAFSSYCVKRVGNSFPNQYNSVLTTDQAYDAFKATHVGANNRLKALGDKEKMFLVTQSVYENLLSSYESKSNGATEVQFKLIQDGTTGLTYRGIDVVPVPYFDTLLEDSTNPWYNNLRHFIIYMPKTSSRFSNLVLGTENASDLNKMDVFYVPEERKMKMQMDFRLGVQFIHCDLLAFHD